jgi:hypothetical protein
MLPDFTSPASFGQRNRDHVFVNIEADVDDMLIHDPSLCMRLGGGSVAKAAQRLSGGRGQGRTPDCARSNRDAPLWPRHGGKAQIARHAFFRESSASVLFLAGVGRFALRVGGGLSGAPPASVSAIKHQHENDLNAPCLLRLAARRRPSTEAAELPKALQRTGTLLSYAAPSAAFARSARLRSLGSSRALRRRIDFGVTSTNSSSST